MGSLLGMVIIIVTVVPLSIFFKWLYKTFPWIERHPLLTWGIVMISLLLFIIFYQWSYEGNR